MVTIRSIQRLAEAKGLSLEELSQSAQVSLQDIQAYTELDNITDEVAANLRQIAATLNVNVIDLFQPLNKRDAIKLKILETSQKKGLTLEELSNRCGVHYAIVAFYSTQPICKQKFIEPLFQENLKKITETLDCNPEDIQAEAELPRTKLNIEDFSRETGLTLENISQVTELPQEFINLISEQPMNVNAFSSEISANLSLTRVWCKICRCCVIDE